MENINNIDEEIILKHIKLDTTREFYNRDDFNRFAEREISSTIYSNDEEENFKCEVLNDIDKYSVRDIVDILLKDYSVIKEGYSENEN